MLEGGFGEGVAILEEFAGSDGDGFVGQVEVGFEGADGVEDSDGFVDDVGADAVAGAESDFVLSGGHGGRISLSGWDRSERSSA